MIDGGVGLGDLAQGRALVPLLPTRLLRPDFSRRLRVLGGFFSPSLDGGLPHVPAVQAKAPFKLGKPRLLGQQQIDQVVFRQNGEGFTIHRILESSPPPRVNQNLGRQRPKSTKSAPFTTIHDLVTIGNLGSYEFGNS